jgi:hypothetical protein
MNDFNITDKEKINLNNYECNNDLNEKEVVDKVKSVFGNSISYRTIDNCISKFGLMAVSNCINDWHKYDYLTKTSPVGLFMTMVKKYNTDERYYAPELWQGKQSNRVGDNKCWQQTNYEQREFTDEYYDSLYDNVTISRS